MSIRLAKESDNTGNPKFWQTQNGHIIYSIDNQPQCSYCSIPSHGWDTCPHRCNDEGRGVFQIYHPQRGMLNQPSESPESSQLRYSDNDPSCQRQDEHNPKQSWNSKLEVEHGHKPETNAPQQRLKNKGNAHPPCPHCGAKSHNGSQCPHEHEHEQFINLRSSYPQQETRKHRDNQRTTIHTDRELAAQTRKRSHTGQGGPHDIKTRPSPTHKTHYRIHITMDDNQRPSTSKGPTTAMSANLMDLPPEIIQTIMLYLPFEDAMRL